VEQRSARLPVTEKVAGSNPVRPAKKLRTLLDATPNGTANPSKIIQ
jgi:hypothetical protein